MAAIGANPDAPGYAGDNTIPPILPGWTAIISTPDNQVNIWDFSGADMFRIAFIHVRNNDDIVTGSLVRDVILGGSGADTLNGNDGNDVLQGGDNTDTLNGDDGDDLLQGYECNGPNAACSSFLNNGSDDDILNGGNGNDCLDGGRGNDSITGGAGSDAFVLFGDTDSDTFNDFMTGDYDPEDPGEVDVVVDLTGNAAFDWVPRKKSTPGKCTITTGGSNAITLTDIAEDDCTSEVINVLGGNDLPAQCTGHPYTFQ
jgi:Ca2+-binding RTX toxin-like protein